MFGGGRRNKLAAVTVPQKPAPTMAMRLDMDTFSFNSW
jgi:hypothetical protein